jgi:hypothetical protein
MSEAFWKAEFHAMKQVADDWRDAYFRAVDDIFDMRGRRDRAEEEDVSGPTPESLALADVEFKHLGIDFDWEDFGEMARAKLEFASRIDAYVAERAAAERTLGELAIEAKEAIIRGVRVREAALRAAADAMAEATEAHDALRSSANQARNIVCASWENVIAKVAAYRALSPNTE